MDSPFLQPIFISFSIWEDADGQLYTCSFELVCLSICAYSPKVNDNVTLKIHLVLCATGQFRASHYKFLVFHKDIDFRLWNDLNNVSNFSPLQPEDLYFSFIFTAFGVNLKDTTFYDEI